MKKISEIYLNYSINLNAILEHDLSKFVMFACAVFYLCGANPAEAQGFDGKKYGEVCKRVLETVEGKFGSLLTAAAGLGALVASATGGFKMAWSLLVVAIGSFTLRTYQEIWFEKCGG